MKNFDLDSNILERMIQLKEENNSSKDEIKTFLMNELIKIDSNDSLIFKKIDSYLKESKLSFQRVSNNWDSMIKFFDESENLSKNSLIKFLMNENDLSESQSKKYVSSYYNYSIRLYSLNNSKDERIINLDNSDY